MVWVVVTRIQRLAGQHRRPWRGSAPVTRVQTRAHPLQLFQENEILTEQEELLAMEQFLRRQIASEKEEIDRLRAEIAEIQRYREPQGWKVPARPCVI